MVLLETPTLREPARPAGGISLPGRLPAGKAGQTGATLRLETSNFFISAGSLGKSTNV